MNISPISAISAPIQAIDPDAARIKPGYGAEVGGITPPTLPAEPGHGEATTFGKMLTNAIAEVNQAQLHAGDMTARFAAGEPLDVHQVMIASQEAGVALNLAMQVRNKIVDGYTEIMHVNV